MVIAIRRTKNKTRKFPAKDKDYALWWLIIYVRRSMHRNQQKELFQLDLTPEQASVLFIVENLGPRVTPMDISRYLLREPHSISGLLSRMEKEGLIKKVKDLERKNLVRVALTKKGKDAYRQSTKQESIQRIMSCLSKEERQQVRTSLEKLWNKALEELGEENSPPFTFPI